MRRPLTKGSRPAKLTDTLFRRGNPEAPERERAHAFSLPGCEKKEEKKNFRDAYNSAKNSPVGPPLFKFKSKASPQTPRAFAPSLTELSSQTALFSHCSIFFPCSPISFLLFTPHDNLVQLPGRRSRRATTIFFYLPLKLPIYPSVHTTGVRYILGKRGASAWTRESKP